MIRTEIGLLLERMIGTMKTWDGHSMRYLFCYNGEGEHESYDCACCLSWEPSSDCGCLCHERIEKMANTGDLRLLFTALQKHEHFPKFAKNYDELEGWRKSALVRGEHHFHNTNGHFSNYPRVVCSVCIPCDEHPKIKYDNYTGELLKTPGVANPYCHTCGSPYPVYRNPLMGEDAGKRCEDEFHPVVVAAPEPEEIKVSGCFFHASPEPTVSASVETDPKTEMPKEWSPGGCVS